MRKYHKLTTLIVVIFFMSGCQQSMNDSGPGSIVSEIPFDESNIIELDPNNSDHVVATYISDDGAIKSHFVEIAPGVITLQTEFNEDIEMESIMKYYEVINQAYEEQQTFDQLYVSLSGKIADPMIIKRLQFADQNRLNLINALATQEIPDEEEIMFRSTKVRAFLESKYLAGYENDPTGRVAAPCPGNAGETQDFINNFCNLNSVANATLPPGSSLRRCFTGPGPSDESPHFNVFWRIWVRNHYVAGPNTLYSLTYYFPGNTVTVNHVATPGTIYAWDHVWFPPIWRESFTISSNPNCKQVRLASIVAN